MLLKTCTFLESSLTGVYPLPVDLESSPDGRPISAEEEVDGVGAGDDNGAGRDVVAAVAGRGAVRLGHVDPVVAARRVWFQLGIFRQFHFENV